MLPQNKPDRIRIRPLVANAGLLLPATLARGPAGTRRPTLTSAERRGQDFASALAGGDCIDEGRAGGTVGVLGCVVKKAFLRSSVRQLD